MKLVWSLGLEGLQREGGGGGGSSHYSCPFFLYFGCCFFFPRLVGKRWPVFLPLWLATQTTPPSLHSRYRASYQLVCSVATAGVDNLGERERDPSLPVRSSQTTDVLVSLGTCVSLLCCKNIRSFFLRDLQTWYTLKTHNTQNKRLSFEGKKIFFLIYPDTKNR